MEPPLDREVHDYTLEGGVGCRDLVDQMARAGGFTAVKLARARHILRAMIDDEDCTTFLSFPAALMATGCRGVLRDLVRRKMVDVVVTTCGTLDHDLARTGDDYYHGAFSMDDAALHAAGVFRLGNVLVPSKAYGTGLERALRSFFQALWDEGERRMSGWKLLELAGERLGDESSLLYWCARSGIPVLVPALTDGAFGYHLWSFGQEHSEFLVDTMQDETLLADRVFDAERSGALVIGGGVSKHHVLWWNQFGDGLDYAVYLTTAVEHDGSLSGARLREAVSWGKVRVGAERVTVEGDASLLLPLLYASMAEG
ncbi:MAG: deoxyhypusine synthase [Thermoplasmata archaeon]